jgi:uncharacterized protein YecE (DUF72 family)
VTAWADAAPAGFAYSLKAPRRITHEKRLKDCADATGRFLEMAALLGDRLGCLLFQLPPNLKRDDDRLEAFLSTLPSGTRAAFEFRHPSWFAPAVCAALERRNLALCWADSETLQASMVRTADYVYCRLRDEGYSADDIGRWAGTVREVGAGGDVFVYFKHEAAGKGPEFARQLMDELGAAP